MHTWKKVMIAAVVALLLSITLFNSSDYSVPKPINGTVVNKLIIPAGRGSASLTLVIKLDNNKMVDISVSPTTYTTCVEGETYIWNFSESFIDFKPYKELCYVFIPFILGVTSFILFLISLIFIIDDN